MLKTDKPEARSSHQQENDSLNWPFSLCEQWKKENYLFQI
jgi:hypothetical protein